MTMQFDRHDGALVAKPSGRLDSNNAGEAEQALLARIDGGETRLVIDLAELDYVSSAGLRVLLLVAKRLRKGGGALSLCRMQEHIREVFEISGFLSILTVCDDLESALGVVKA